MGRKFAPAPPQTPSLALPEGIVAIPGARWRRKSGDHSGATVIVKFESRGNIVYTNAKGNRRGGASADGGNQQMARYVFYNLYEPDGPAELARATGKGKPADLPPTPPPSPAVVAATEAWLAARDDEIRAKESEESLKLCPLCVERRPRSEYGPDTAKSDGLQSMCRTCRNFRRRGENASKSTDEIRQLLRAERTAPEEPSPMLTTTDSAIIEEKRAEHEVLKVARLKQCNVCHNFLPRDAFNKRTSASDGLQITCKDCHRAKYYPAAKAKARQARQAAKAPERPAEANYEKAPENPVGPTSEPQYWSPPAAMPYRDISVAPVPAEPISEHAYEPTYEQALEEAAQAAAGALTEHFTSVAQGAHWIVTLEVVTVTRREEHVYADAPLDVLVQVEKLGGKLTGMRLAEGSD